MDLLHLLALVGAGLREAVFMVWETLWALVLGFGLSGAVQAFVSRDEMQRTLGDRSAGSLGRATLFGMASSSCSYAASAMAKSLFQKGADFTASMVFMFASTNLVIELGLVLWVLMGWQFAASEFVGGLIMIGLFALLARVVFTPALVEAARRRARADTAAADHEAAPRREPWRTRVRSLAGWTDAAGYTMADLTMLRKEMVIGYGVAGFLAVLIPPAAWQVVFLSGHGFWTSLENVVVGPFIALISFVCSVGNVPLAAALWQGGIGFGGVVSFIFADLITLPLILIYRKFYGRRLTLRLLAVSWAVMSAAGLVVEYLFRLLGLAPAHRPAQIVPETLSWNYTTVLDLIFLGVFAVLYYLSRNRARWGGGAGYAVDPVCGMQVRAAQAPATVHHAGRTRYFCSDRCHDRFVAAPARYLAPASRPESPAMGVPMSGDRPMSIPMHDARARAADAPTDAGASLDPVCGMPVDAQGAAAERTNERANAGTRYTYRFCSPGCAAAFDADPARYMTDVASKR